MYLPKRLQPYIELIDEKHGTNIIVKGILSCCDQHRFHITFSGKLTTSLVGHKYIKQEKDAVVIIANCAVCGKEIPVFNSCTDGYDNCVNHFAAPSSFGFNNFSCSKCSTDCFSIELSFEYQSKEELENDGVHEYENAFSWIWISPTCSCCKKTYRNLIDIETS